MSPPAELDVTRCDLDGINLIEASAGTGKTWNICGLYLRLLLERGLDTQRILVVTFTNAATAELRARIRARIVETRDFLAGTASDGGDPFVPRLIDALVNRRGLNPDDLARRLDLALETFDEAAIFTIHGFCQRALADTPFAAGLPMTMELVQDDTEYRMRAVHDFWRRHIAGEALSPALATTLAAKGDTPEKYAALLKRHLAKPLATRLWPAEIDHDADHSADLDTAALAADFAAARATWAAAGESIVECLLDALPQLNGQTYKEASVRRGGQEWDEYFQRGTPLATPGEKCALYRLTMLVDRTKKKCVTPSHPFFEQAEALLARWQALDSALTLARLRLIRSLLDEAGAGLRELKRAQRLVSFDDMLFNLRERLCDGASPWLAPALRQRFPAALIDEFQDTDPLQFDIFRAIYGGADAAANGPLFLVGDPKQAIYSFRNADLHTYLRARQEASVEHALVANQRSSAGLLDALNQLFGANDQAFMLPGLDYRRAEFGAKPRKPFVDRTAPGTDLRVWMLHDAAAEPPAKAVARRAVVTATAAEIARLIDAGNAGDIEIGGQPLRPGDIAVLARSHAQGGEVKRALARLGIGSVELSQASVFRTVDAEEVERVLRAVLEPGREPLVRAALATELIGRDAGEIEAISNDEAALMRALLQFNDYRETWFRRGFGVMYRRLFADEHVAERMLRRPDGERRLTNFLHLGECLRQEAEAAEAPEALLRYLEARRRDDTAEEAAQLRLESDQNLVQIVTIHKSKGLEYPIVFAPFLWDGRAFAGKAAEGAEYHDDDGQPVIDLRGDFIEKDERDAIKAKIKLEQSAETLRLLYVALTRAVYRCYLVAGCYSNMAFGRPSSSESAHGMLNWLALGAGQTPQDWFAGKPTADDVTAAWADLGRNPHIDVAPLPSAAGVAITRAATDPATLAALTAPAAIPNGWRLSSYSGLNYGAVSELAASDHDARIGPSTGTTPADIAADDILRFPRGAAAGDCIHAVFERSDFTDARTWEAAIATALDRHPQTLPGVPDPTPGLARMLTRLLRDVTGAELAPGLRLDTVPWERRLVELEFNLPARHLAASALNETLKTLGYAGPRLTFSAFEGYLKGFIDLVFEHQGRYFILDWKSNHLGHDAAAYAAAPVAEAMATHGYHLQYLLYTLALDRYLRRRIPDYHYDTHFGGVFYLFVRGVRPGWKTVDGTTAGVYFHLPDPATLGRLNTLLESPQRVEAGLRPAPT